MFLKELTFALVQFAPLIRRNSGGDSGVSVEVRITIQKIRIFTGDARVVDSWSFERSTAFYKQTVEQGFDASLITSSVD